MDEIDNCKILCKNTNQLPRDSASDVKGEEVETTAALVIADDFPDGGLQAWIVLCGTVSGFFATLGYVNSWGVFQAYYQQKLLRHSTPSEIAWIGSIQHAMIFLPAVVVGRLFDIGYFRIPYAAGGLLIVLTTFLVPQCKVYWHYLLCQGFGSGIGSGLMFCTMVTVTTHWFKKRRGFALGVASGGAALGATVFPIIIRQLITRIGFPWALRTVGFILIFFLGISNLCVRRRLPPVKARGGLLGLHAFRNIPFSVLGIGAFLTLMGLFTMLTYISASAIAFGISPNFAFYLVAITNFSSGVGRVTSGILGDRFGLINANTVMTTLAGVATIVWPHCRTIPSITVIASIYGFTSGAWLALIGPMIGQLGNIDDIGRRMGTVHTIVGVSTICGPPISGLFADSKLGYMAVGYFAGDMIIAGTAIKFIARLIAAPSFFRKF
ncbi:major facilitator superfamily domain-containing protein [Mycena pura]|uniref:Major facilitator superfamily domain-containing protein n=1 Tax=Mycena pura TaxID=153505 RepID=A0AAD6VFV8_9AGAR|nr:major facilitator superfamily domain-containing protein [Mycena pura]